MGGDIGMLGGNSSQEKLTEEQQAARFPNGITNKLYYKFLDNFDLNTEQTKPLEKDRDLWLTSKVRPKT